MADEQPNCKKCKHGQIVESTGGLTTITDVGCIHPANMMGENSMKNGYTIIKNDGTPPEWCPLKLIRTNSGTVSLASQCDHKDTLIQPHPWVNLVTMQHGVTYTCSRCGLTVDVGKGIEQKEKVN